MEDDGRKRELKYTAAPVVFFLGFSFSSGHPISPPSGDGAEASWTPSASRSLASRLHLHAPRLHPITLLYIFRRRLRRLRRLRRFLSPPPLSSSTPTPPVIPLPPPCRRPSQHRRLCGPRRRCHCSSRRTLLPLLHRLPQKLRPLLRHRLQGRLHPLLRLRALALRLHRDNPPPQHFRCWHTRHAIRRRSDPPPPNPKPISSPSL